MSGLGRAFAAAQARFDDMAPPELDDDDALTEDQALEQARDELLATPEVVADALSAAIGYSRESVGVFALSGSGDPLDAVAVETLTTAQLLAVVMVGHGAFQTQALGELQERLAFHLRDDIKQRAMDKRVDQEREWLRMRDDAAMDRYLDRLEAA